MFFAKEKEEIRIALESFEDVKRQMEAVNSRIDNIQQQFSDEIGLVKNDISVLALSIREIDKQVELPVQQAPQPNIAPDVAEFGLQLDQIREDLANIQEWTKSVAPSFKAVNASIADAKKDIKNKITYATSKLKR